VNACVKALHLCVRGCADVRCFSVCARAWESIGDVVLLCGAFVCVFGRERQCVSGKFVAGQV
jgi:hypothetical protein